MAKPKIVPSKQAHQVTVQDGAKVAQRKSTQKVPQESENPYKQGIKARTTPSNSRPVVRLTPRPPVIPPPRRPTGPSMAAAPTRQATPQTQSSSPLWAPDDTVRHRLHALRDRNALLADQLDRLANFKR